MTTPAESAVTHDGALSVPDEAPRPGRRGQPAPAATNPSADALLSHVAAQIRDLRRQLTLAEGLWAQEIDQVDASNRASAVNLIHYWAIRQCDLRELQSQLAAFGLSSLGRAEPHVQATLQAIATTVEALSGNLNKTRRPAAGFGNGPRLLRRRAVELFGPAPRHRQTRIMVTLPPEAATDPELVRDLVEHGMELARVNCAHDDSGAWAAMIRHVRAAEAATGRRCKVAMDLPGPKLRTGPLADGPQVIKLKPTRDSMGVMTAPGQGWLTSTQDPQPPPQPDLTPILVPRAWLARLEVDDTIELSDSRGKKRHLQVDTVDAHGVLVSAGQTAYLSTGTVLRTHRGHRAVIAALPALDQFLTLHMGDELILTRDCSPAALPTGRGPAHIGCTLPEAFDHVQIGHEVHLDDGKINGLVTATATDRFTVRITSAAVNGTRLRAAKGINLPDTFLPIPALTATDRANLPFISRHADIVEMSFARSAQDVTDLLAALTEPGDDQLGIILKIETAQGFSNLPSILLAAMQHPHTGVMIARGDLAGECGYERLAELQEEIMWLAEAAHLPVIWATQVLDQMARTGQPTRAEITDAAMGVRAECVMLNKGPYILAAVDTLGDILTRMTGHHDKKNALLRPLSSWRTVGGTIPSPVASFAAVPALDGRAPSEP